MLVAHQWGCIHCDWCKHLGEIMTLIWTVIVGNSIHFQRCYTTMILSLALYIRPRFLCNRTILINYPSNSVVIICFAAFSLNFSFKGSVDFPVILMPTVRIWPSYRGIVSYVIVALYKHLSKVALIY